MLDISEYEKMAKLKLPNTEREQIGKYVEMLVESFKILEEIETESVEPLVTVLNLQNVLRQDKCVKAFTREELLSNAPEHYDGYFQVPRTLD